MKTITIICLIAGFFSFFSCKSQRNKTNPRQIVLFDFDWRFHRGEVENGACPGIDDSSWRSLNLPHDWSIEDLPGKDSPFDSTAIGGIDYGFLVGGTAWYRKTFDMPNDGEGKKIRLFFGGVYKNADIWLNGKLIGNHPYGYTSFEYEITEYLEKVGNVLAIRVENEGRSSRWYPGSGIYRHVWLKMTDPIHVATWGTSITTPEVSELSARIVVENTLLNESGKETKLAVVTNIFNPSGEIVATLQSEQTLEAKSKIKQEATIQNPELWSIETPYLYTAVTEISEKGVLKDRVENPFGIRSLKFSAEGFFLNGKHTLLKGGCMHHGNGPLGTAAYDRAEERRVELMKASGFNSIRCAHNPPSTAFLNACDRLGMLVIVESFDMWKVAKRPQDYHLHFDDWWRKDIEAMVLRDRNHPSVIMWSTGNEIPERAKPEGVETSSMLTDYVHELDPTRPVTAAVQGLAPDKDPYFATLDVAGYNYPNGRLDQNGNPQEDIFAKDLVRVPDRIIYGAESYPLTAFHDWMGVLDNKHVIGDFVWTGFDYLGEASIGWMGYPQKRDYYPWHLAYCGDIDVCGIKRPQSYYRDVLWQHESGYPVSLFVKPPKPSFDLPEKRAGWSLWHWYDLVADWNWEGMEGKEMEVSVFSMYPEVELFLNEKSLGKKLTSRSNEWSVTYKVPYKAGELKAVGYIKGQQKSVFALKTAGEASKIVLKADRTTIHADGQDLSYIRVELQDDNGVRNPKAQNRINFKIEGPGEIVAVGSSNPRITESFRKPYRNAWEGRCLVIVKSKQNAGEILLSATAIGLKNSNVKIISQ